MLYLKSPLTFAGKKGRPWSGYLTATASEISFFKGGRHLFLSPASSKGLAHPVVDKVKMDHDEPGFQAPPVRPTLCIKNCGFFGSSATMNMCSKCHKNMLMQEEQAKLAAASFENIVSGSSSCSVDEKIVSSSIPETLDELNSKPATEDLGVDLTKSCVEDKPKEHPTRCSSCRKRVGLAGFTCRCGNVFCGSHRYSDKHECPFDYRSAAREAIAKANPVVKTDKLDKV